MRRIKTTYCDSTIMLQENNLFLHTAEEKNYNEELDFSGRKTPSLSTSSAIVATCIAISILGLIANGITFWLLCYVLKKTKFTIYVINLTAGDFLSLLHSLVFLIGWYTPSLIRNRAYKAFLMLLVLGYAADPYFLAAMSIERCLIVFSPAWYQSHRQKRSTLFVCIFIWILTVMLKVFGYFLCEKYQISDLPIHGVPCELTLLLKFIIGFGIVYLIMILSNLVLCIRMKIRPEDGFPTRLDYSIWSTVILHLILLPVIEIIGWIITSYPSITSSYHFEFLYLDMITYRVSISVDPFVYLVVGCWKWEKGQQPFYMFLERALKDDGKSSMRTQPVQEQPREQPEL